MIDINELRQSLGAVTPEEIAELLDRLEAAESDGLEQARLLGMSGEREAALLSKLEAAEKERDALRADLEKERKEHSYTLHAAEAEAKQVDRLRAKIEAMEKQEPVAWMLNCQTLSGDTGWILSWTQSGAGLCNRLKGEENEKRLYTLPGAQPAPSVPIDSIWKLLTQAMDVAVANSANSASMPDELVEVAAWLAAAPKPEGE